MNDGKMNLQILVSLRKFFSWMENRKNYNETKISFEKLVYKLKMGFLSPKISQNVPEMVLKE